MIGKGIEINNIHTYRDLGVSISSKDIGAPELNRITQTVPFMNGVYDFSDLYGEETYGERILKYEFDLSDISKELMNARKIKLINFFKNNQNSIFRDDTIKGYHFYFERMISHRFKESGFEGILTVSLAMYPFKIRDIYEGNNCWDDFNFELDILQDTKFAVNGSKSITLWNLGSKKVSPIILLSNMSPRDLMRIDFNGNTYNLTTEVTGYNSVDAIKLNPGANKLNLYGNGTVEFKFRKELL